MAADQLGCDEAMTHSEIIHKLATGIAHSEYSLLLGAGASLGAVGGNGRPLPTAIQLRNALVDHFGIETGGESTTLVQVYDYCSRHFNRRLTKYLSQWFRGCQPSWQNLIAEFNWRRIWTFNIDDVLENAFSKEGRPTRSLNWNQRFVERDNSNAQQIIHLHGQANGLKERQQNDGGLVFSISEYARIVANPRAWHKVLFDEFAGRPFLVIGARLSEEFDFAEVLEGGSTAYPSTGFPSVLVVPSITPMRREQLEAAGLTIVEERGEPFIRQLLDHYRKVRDELDEVYGTSTPGIRKFQQQFIDLRKFTPHGVNAGDFYSGYEPTWDTVLKNDDALLHKTKEASDECMNLSVSEDIFQSVVVLTGGASSGKSAGLLRIANSLIGKGVNPYLFRADEYMDVEATLEWLTAVPRTVLLIDDISDFSSAIQELAKRCRTQKLRMLLICSDRSSRLPLIRDRIDSQYLDPTYWYGSLTKKDIDAIIDKLHSRGRLGKITRWSRESQRNHFSEFAGRRLFDSMSELESGVGFKEKATKRLSELADRVLEKPLRRCLSML